MAIYLYMNEQHKLMTGQQELITARFGEAEITKVFIPASGWDKQQIHQAAAIPQFGDVAIVLSPIPLLLGVLAARGSQGEHGGLFGVLVFHNEKREAKEVASADGSKRLIHVLADDGWELIGVN